MKTIILVLLVLNVASAFSQDHIQFSVHRDQKNKKEITFETAPGHHFNLKSPNKVDAQKSEAQWITAKKIVIKDRRAIAVFNENVSSCHSRARLFVCDDKNTYCLPRSLEFQCDEDKVIQKEWKFSDNSVAEKAPYESEDFILNDSAKALTLAKKENKPIMVDFFGVWCPPCNQLDETVFSTKEFKKIKDRFVLLKLDADKSASWDFKSKFKIKGYPTVVFASENGEEITRIVGARSRGVFIGEMKKVLKNRDRSADKLKILADEKNDLEAAYDLGLIYLERDEFSKALSYFNQASSQWSKNDPRRNKILTAQLGLAARSPTPDENAKRGYLDLLSKALELYPKTTEAIERGLLLAEGAKELNDKNLETKSRKKIIETARFFLQNPKNLKHSEWTRGDLYEVIGEQYASLEMKKESQAAYKQAAWDHEVLMKKTGQDPNKERGYNLNRIYSIWKSGDVIKARKLYEGMQNVYPKEFTFYYYHARLLDEIKLSKEALEKAEKAYEYSYGDNRLRVSALLASLYDTNGDKKKALQLLNKEILSADLPDDKTIRTYRYLDKLKQLKARLQN